MQRTPSAPLMRQPLGDRAKSRTVAVAICLLTFSSAARAVVVRIELIDVVGSKTSQHLFDSQSGSAREVEAAACHGVTDSSRFSIGAERLILAGQALLKADDLLAQGEAEGVAFAVVRYEYNSFANPWRIFAALSGHPIQVSQIIVVAVKGDRVVSKATVRRKGAAYSWKAKLCQ